MQNETFNEQDSLRIITEMIHKTKNNVIKKDFNEFLFYGYTVLLASVAVYATVYFTGNPDFMFLWTAMCLLYLLKTFAFRKPRPEAVTYLEDMLNKVWKIIGSMFGLTLLAMFGCSPLVGRVDFSLMMPLSIIYAGIGTSITGLLIKENSLTYTPLIGLVLATYMLLEGTYDNSWNLLFGAAFLIFMVIPAHICRRKY